MATVTKRGESYRIRVSCGYDIFGRQIVYTKTWKPEPGMSQRQIENELERQKVYFEEEARSNTIIGQNMTFARFSEIWFDKYGKEHLKASTFKNYQGMMPRINAAIGHIAIGKIQPNHLISFYSNLAEEGIRADGKYKAIVDIDEIKKQLGISSTKLKEKSGLSYTTVKSVLAGENVSLKTASAISNALGMQINKLFAPVDGTKKKLSGTTLLYYHRIISSIMQTAVYWQIISVNPCKRVKPPKADKSEAIYLDEDEAELLLDALDCKPLLFKTFVTLLLFSGLRRGEAMGLRWYDLDFDNCLVNINKELLYVRGEGVKEYDTKNSSSHRVIKIPKYVFQLFGELRDKQLADSEGSGTEWSEDRYIFSFSDGLPVNPDTMSGHFHDFIMNTDLPRIHLHSLRHTNATLLIANGIDIRTVSKRLGHAESSTTMNIYAHAIASADAKASDALELLLNKKKSTEE